MANAEQLRRLVRDRYQTADELADAWWDSEVQSALNAYLDELEKVVGEEVLLDARLRDELLLAFLREILEDVLTKAEALDMLQEARNEGVEDTEPVGYVYLGPDDTIERPFCDVLNGTWLTREEIDQLNNGQITDTFATRGGYNCRHGWYALYDIDERNEFPHGSVSEANAAVVR